MNDSRRGSPIANSRLLAAALLFVSLLIYARTARAVQFSDPVDYAVGSNPVSIAVGDVNGDGKLDLAVANAGDGTTANPGSVSILLGNGDGTFQAAVDYAAGQTPNSVAVGDFNGDGNLDLAVANQGLASAGIDGSVSILLGKGDGTFQPAVEFTAGPNPNSIVVGEFNGDGKLDLVVADPGDATVGDDGSVSVLLGIGDGTFQPAVGYPAGQGPRQVVVGDFNLDGSPDLVVLDGASTYPTLSILLGNGDGTFQSPVAFSRGNSFLVADFNGDGKPDVVANGVPITTNLFPHRATVLLLGNGDGTFQPAVSVISFPILSSGGAEVVADFNGDSKLDLAGWKTSRSICLFSGCVPVTITSSFILLGRGDGTFVQVSGPQSGSFSKITADFNGDNLPDLAAVRSDKVSILLNTSPTTGADLGLKNTRSRDPVAVGHNQTYSIQVVNEGPEDATGVTLTDTLPGELTLVSTTPSQGSCQGASSITCDLGLLASAGSATVTIEVTVNAPGTNNTISNTATVSTTESDSRPWNNTATANTKVTDFDLVFQDDAMTVTAGGSVTDSVYLQPVDGFNQTATLACAGAPPQATCDISPNSITLDGVNQATATLTVTTTARSSALVLPWAKPSVMGRHWSRLWTVFLLALALLIVLAVRRSAPRPIGGMVLAASVLLVVFWVACGGNNKVERGTPPGTYTLTVTATSGSFTQSQTVNLTVN